MSRVHLLVTSTRYSSAMEEKTCTNSEEDRQQIADEVRALRTSLSLRSDITRAEVIV